MVNESLDRGLVLLILYNSYEKTIRNSWRHALCMKFEEFEISKDSLISHLVLMKYEMPVAAPIHNI